jgi:23S rRNA (cytosine1962-C5)-methyltransferase
LQELIKSSFSKREYLFENEETDCFRLFNSEGDGIEGLTVDLYGEFLLVQYFNRDMADLLAGGTSLINHIISASDLFPVALRGVLVKNRLRSRSASGIQQIRESCLVDGEPPGSEYSVKQNGVRAYVDLIHGQNTGLFLDMREVRESLKPFYGDTGIKSMANLFSYTSIFSVHGLKNGIEHSVNVDLSKGVLRKSMDNYRLNTLRVDQRDFIYGDALKWIRMFEKKHRSFNFIIFDPPTFSRNKRRNFSVKKDYSGTLKMLENISDDGYILTSVNSNSVSRDEYISYHPPYWKNLLVMNESSDFIHPGVPYLKVGLWKI